MVHRYPQRRGQDIQALRATLAATMHRGRDYGVLKITMDVLSGGQAMPRPRRDNEVSPAPSGIRVTLSAAKGLS
jgi:hypothetical protein